MAKFGSGVSGQGRIGEESWGPGDESYLNILKLKI